jgi:hypothetical protein
VDRISFDGPVAFADSGMHRAHGPSLNIFGDGLRDALDPRSKVRIDR